MIERDFTFKKYLQLCEKMVNSDYEIMPVERYFTEDKPHKLIILRHDVDDGVDIPYTLKMARKEAELGIHSTYYFRVNDEVFKPEVIREVKELGHEIGYHYDVLGKANGDYECAIELFKEELAKLRSIYDVKTISMHGGPFSSNLNAASFKGLLEVVKNVFSRNRTFVNWDSRDLWRKYDFEDYGIMGEVYLSIDYSRVLYLSDTNRSWSDTKRRLMDFVEGSDRVKLNGTNELMELIERGEFERMLILTHPPVWRDEYLKWLNWLILQQIKNLGKTFLKYHWKNKKN
ncbi:MAG: hypothetical protein ACOC5L_03390 [Halobacteriota archaeon]